MTISFALVEMHINSSVRRECIGLGGVIPGLSSGIDPLCSEYLFDQLVISGSFIYASSQVSAFPVFLSSRVLPPKGSIGDCETLNPKIALAVSTRNSPPVTPHSSRVE
jgi:hypothetical protein